MWQTRVLEFLEIANPIQSNPIPSFYIYLGKYQCNGKLSLDRRLNMHLLPCIEITTRLLYLRWVGYKLTWTMRNIIVIQPIEPHPRFMTIMMMMTCWLCCNPGHGESRQHMPLNMAVEKKSARIIHDKSKHCISKRCLLIIHSNTTALIIHRTC